MHLTYKKKRRKIMKNQKGFTIIETMFAMSIFAMGLVAAVGLHYSTARNNRNANVLSIVMMAAKTQVEVLRNQNIGDLVEGTFTQPVDEKGVVVTYTITKDPINIRIGTVVVSATLRNKVVKIETKLNNYWGKNDGITARPGI
jgi:prepilin-type N-terminal cleavage/methylation domain-containing protein